MMTNFIRNKRNIDEVTSSASTLLTDLSDELLTLVVLNLNFRERSVTRRVCRTLCRVADALQLPHLLQVTFFRSQEERPADPSIFNPRSLQKWQLMHARGHCVVGCNHFTTNIDILLDHEIDGQDRILQLRAIRPVQLKLEAAAGISSQLLRRMFDQLPGTVTILSIVHLEIDSPLALYDAFSAFRNNGRLTHLRFEAFSRIRPVLFAVTALPSLVRLDLVMSERAFPEWNDASMEQIADYGLELIALQSLPSLRELSAYTIDTPPCTQIFEP
jgi:hypothetical protein